MGEGSLWGGTENRISAGQSEEQEGVASACDQSARYR